jgi:GNAT superfamily N-acetyltransferase
VVTLPVIGGGFGGASGHQRCKIGAVHLAQLNIARLTQPLDHPATAEFVDGLDPINALAESSPGYVWRLQGESGDATTFRPHPDPNVIVNLTVWESPEHLHDFVFKSAHTPFLRRRAEWFTPMGAPQVVAWWIDAGHLPTVEEAFARLTFLTEHGASPYAFTVTRPLAQLAFVHDIGDDGPVLFASLDNEPAGFASGKQVYVRPAMRGRRIGRALLAELDLVGGSCDPGEPQH